jgi:lipopolysaccharide transport system ATP-binding protein
MAEKRKMSDIAIRVENLSKRYHIGRTRERHDTLRDALADFRLRILDFGRKSPIRNPKTEEIWALKDVSFEIKRGEAL